MKVIMHKTYRYKNEIIKPYDEFEADSADKAMLVKDGAIILSDNKPSFVKKEEVKDVKVNK